jgi:hypothetical protein
VINYFLVTILGGHAHQKRVLKSAVIDKELGKDIPLHDYL